MDPDTIVLDKTGAKEFAAEFARQITSGIEGASVQEPNSYFIFLAALVMAVAMVVVVFLFLRGQAQQQKHVNEVVEKSQEHVTVFTEKATGAVERCSQTVEQNGRLFERCTRALEKIVPSP